MDYTDEIEEGLISLEETIDHLNGTNAPSEFVRLTVSLRAAMLHQLEASEATKVIQDKLSEYMIAHPISNQERVA